ncbi:uncharacterized protein [Antedon mediterranea]
MGINNSVDTNLGKPGIFAEKLVVFHWFWPHDQSKSGRITDRVTPKEDALYLLANMNSINQTKCQTNQKDLEKTENWRLLNIKKSPTSDG